MKTRITALVLVVGLVLPAFAATRSARKLEIGSPKASSPAVQLQEALQFSNDAVTKLKQETASFEIQVNSLVSKNIYDQASANTINKRNNGVNGKVAKVVKQYIADLNKLIAKKKIKSRKTYVPLSPFGKAISSIPSASSKDKLLALQKQESQMAAYDSNAIMALSVLLDSSAKNALQKSVANTLIKAFNNDKKEILKIDDQINDKRFSTAGITAWKSAEVSNVADNKNYSGSTLEIQEGFETSLRSTLQMQSGNKFLVNFQEIVGWSAQFSSASDSYVQTDCSSTGTGSSSGISFQGAMDHPECGSANIKVDNKGRVSGEVNNFLPPQYPGGWGLSKILINGLVKKDGTAEFSSITIPLEGLEFGQRLLNESSLK